MSRHLATAQTILIWGLVAVAILAALALAGIDSDSIRVVAGVASDLLMVVGGIAGVSASRHVGEGFRKPATTTPPGA
jgi:hypothetical protein